MVEIPLNELLSAGYEAPKLVLKEYRELEKVEDEETLDQKISGILQLFPVRPSKAEVHGETAENAGSRLTKNSKILVDLESPVPPEDEMLSKQQERVEKVLGANFLSGSKFEVLDKSFLPRCVMNLYSSFIGFLFTQMTKELMPPILTELYFISDWIGKGYESWLAVHQWNYARCGQLQGRWSPTTSI